MGPGNVYTIVHSGETMVGGMVSGMTPARTPPHWFDYVEVDNVDKRAEGFASAGGKILRPPFDIPNVGRFYTFQDPQGAVISIITYRMQGATV